MKYAVQAVRNIRHLEWTAVRQVPTFTVEASSHGEACAVAYDILGLGKVGGDPGGTTHLSVGEV